jgi:GT2 family glycosyltransferase
MKTSIIIPVFNQLAYTKKCMESIFSFGSKYDFEVIVVDNASTDDSREYLKGLGNKVTVIHNEKNLGFAKACNQGARIARGEYLLFLNNDTVVTNNWLDILVKELDNNEDVAIVGPKLLYPDNTIQHAGIVFDENKWPHHIYKRENKDEPYVNKKRRFQCLTAACLLVRSSVFKAVNGFDEAYVNGMEDTDFCFKVGELGFGILYCPESVIYHYGSISIGRHSRDKKNKELFLKRWRQKIKIDHADFMAKDGTDGYCRFMLRFLRKLTEQEKGLFSSN